MHKAVGGVNVKTGSCIAQLQVVSYLVLGILRDLFPYGFEARFVKPVGFSLFYKVAAAPLFIRVTGNQLNMVMIVGTVTHGAQIYPLAPVNLPKNLHEPFGEANDFFVDVIGRFAHIMIVVNGSNAHMSLCSRIAHKEALDLIIFIQHLIRQIAVKSATVFTVKTGGANTHIC